MAGSAQRKVKGGKLLRVWVEHSGSFVTDVTITGDFFVHPEEGLSIIEQQLIGTPIEEDRRCLASRIEGILASNRITVLGFGPEDLAIALREALS